MGMEASLHPRWRMESVYMWKALKKPEEVGQNGLEKVPWMDPHTHTR